MNIGDFDFYIIFAFTNLDKISKYLDPHRLAVTESDFGVLLAALAI